MTPLSPAMQEELHRQAYPFLKYHFPATENATIGVFRTENENRIQEFCEIYEDLKISTKIFCVVFLKKAVPAISLGFTH